jgi:hypothetical protein
MKCGNSFEELSPNEIKELVKDLYSLPLKGEELKKNMEVATNSYARMVSYNEVHYRPKYQYSKNSLNSNKKPRKGLFGYIQSVFT